MSTRNAMTQRCSIQRDAGRASSDPYGGQVTPVWEDRLTGVPCRFWLANVRTAFDGGTQKQITVQKMAVPLDTDVTEDDRIGWIRDRRGNSLSAVPLRINGVGRRKDHLILDIVGVR